MKRLFLATIALLAGTTLFAQQQPDAVYKLLREEWTVNADGTSDYHHRHEVQIMRNRALTAYADKGETFVVYNPDFEELTVNEVYTVMTDGRRVEMPQNAFIYQLPSQCADCGRYNHLRELAMVHTGMELGCVIVVDYTIHRNYNLVSRTLDLVQNCPIERLEVNITVPADQELNATLNNPKVVEFNPTVEQTAHSYSLKANNVPQTFADSYLPAKNQLYPTLRFFNGVPQYMPAFNTEAFDKAEDAIGRVTQSNNDKENIVAIRNYVVDNIHLNDIDPAMLGYTHATAEEVWQSGCGTATDKAVLLAAILNHEEFTAHVTGDQNDEVGVMIDTLEYRLSVRGKVPMALFGEAKDEVDTIHVDFPAKAAELDTIGDGFYSLSFMPRPASPGVNAANMALVRTAPLQSRPCDIRYSETYTLPKGVKMVGNAISEKQEYEGIGSVEVTIKQSGKKLIVVRNLKLDQSIVPASDYANYRRLIAAWQNYDRVLLRSK